MRDIYWYVDMWFIMRNVVSYVDSGLVVWIFVLYIDIIAPIAQYGSVHQQESSWFKLSCENNHQATVDAT